MAAEQAKQAKQAEQAKQAKQAKQDRATSKKDSGIMNLITGDDGSGSEFDKLGDSGDFIDIDDRITSYIDYQSRQFSRTIIAAILFIFTALFIASAIVAVAAAAENGFPESTPGNSKPARFVGEKLVPVPDPKFKKGRVDGAADPELAGDLVEVAGEVAGLGAGLESATASQVIRPVVEVDCWPDAKCLPCKSFKAWHKSNGDLFPLEFRITTHAGDLPARVYSNSVGVPAFFWRDDSGKLMTFPGGGWPGPEAFLATWRQSNPRQFSKMSAMAPSGPSGLTAPANVPAASSSESPLDLFRKFAGPGKFSWKPDKPVSTYSDTTTHIQYTELTGTATVDPGNSGITLTLSRPFPVVSVKRWGMWFNADLLGAIADPSGTPPTATLDTSRGKFKVELKEVNQK